MKIELSEAFPIQSLQYLAGLCYRPVTRPRTYYANLLWNIIYNFGFKFQPVDEIFLQVERTVLLRRVHQTLIFLTHLIAYA